MQRTRSTDLRIHLSEDTQGLHPCLDAGQLGRWTALGLEEYTLRTLRERGVTAATWSPALNTWKRAWLIRPSSTLR